VEAIRSLVQNLIVIIILAMLLEMFLPAGEMRKYVKMVMGLLIIVAVVQAVGELVRWDYRDEIPPLTEKNNEAELSGIMAAASRITGNQEQKALEQYKSGLSKQVRALVHLHKETPVLEVDVKVQSGRNEPDYGQLKEIILFVAGETSSGKESEGAVKEGVEPVTVQIGSTIETDEHIENRDSPAGAAEADLISMVANFYNLSTEQVKIIYR